MGNLDDVFRRSLDDPNGFWAEAASALEWDRPWERVLDDSDAPHYRWFTGGAFNTCRNAVDRHVEAGRADQLALIYDSPVSGARATLTYRELRDAVATFAGVLVRLGVERGDRVVIYMPMVPEAVIAMLACARIGAVHSVVFGGFASLELAARIDDAQPKVVVSASCGIEPSRLVPYKPLLDAAIESARVKPQHCVILQRPMLTAELGARDIDWDDAVPGADPVGCVPVEATDPLYILYTSGTTGQPKGIVRDNGGHAVALAWSMRNVFNAAPGERYWAASDIGWVVGHSYIVYGPLLQGCTTVLYEGKPVGTPDAGAYWRMVSEHSISTLFTAPTAFRAIRQHDPDARLMRDYDLSPLRALFLAGERCDPSTLLWASDKLRIPVVDHWWQTETGWPMVANPLGIEQLPVKPGSATRPVPGWDIRVVDEAGSKKPVGEIGSLVVKLPMPPGALPTLWHAHERFRETYLSEYAGFYQTYDAGYVDEDGYVFVMSRTDDVINVAGHRLSTGALEEIVASHPAVAECAVIGVPDALKGELPLGLVVLKAGVAIPDEEVSREVVALVRENLGPVAAFRTALVVDRLPKTRSGKILRRTLRQLASGEEPSVPATIEDPAVLDEVAAVFERLEAQAQRGRPASKA